MSQALVYNENSDMQKEDGLKLISFISFHDGMKVLDLGCGTGYLSNVLAERVGQTGKVVGIDPDNERIAIAREKYGSISNLSFQEGSTDGMIPGEGFDAVFSNYVLHWVEDKKKAFENVFRCLQPSGLFAACICMKVQPYVQKFIDLMGASRASKVNSMMHFLSINEIEELASTYGFTVQYKEEINRSYIFDSSAKFDHFVKSVYGSFGGLIDTQFMDAEMLDKYRQDGCTNEFSLILVYLYVFKKKNKSA